MARGLQELVNHPEAGVVAPVWDPGGKALIYTQRVGKWESHIFKIMFEGGSLGTTHRCWFLEQPRRLV